MGCTKKGSAASLGINHCSFTMAGEEDGTDSFAAFAMEDDRDRAEHDPDIADLWVVDTRIGLRATAFSP